MRTATALATVEPIQGQIPLPFPRPAKVIALPVQRGGGDDPVLRSHAARLTQAIVEVLAGRRPPRQLEPWLTAPVLAQLQSRLRIGSRRPVGRSARLASLHVSEIDTGVAEITGRIVIADRSRALALRLERLTDHHGRTGWRCTALEWG